MVAVAISGKMYGLWWAMGYMLPTPLFKWGHDPARYQGHFLSKVRDTVMFPSLATFKNVSFLTAPERVKSSLSR